MGTCPGDSAQEPTIYFCNKTTVSVYPQGEQCNIVPDNVDDIVADIAQEEKEDGKDPGLSLFFLTAFILQ